MAAYGSSSPPHEPTRPILLGPSMRTSTKSTTRRLQALSLMILVVGFVTCIRVTRAPHALSRGLAVQRQSVKVMAGQFQDHLPKSGPSSSLWKNMKNVGAPGITILPGDSPRLQQRVNADSYSAVSVPSESAKAPCSIKVVGVGGGGGNTVNRMIESIDEEDASVEFWAVNTDVQALCKSKAPNRIQIGPSTTKGLGAGAKPTIGRAAAVESVKAIESALSKTDMVFVTAGMGGGTGSGATPVIAEVARRAGSLTVGIVTKPFGFEGQIRMNQAVGAIEELRKQVDILIVVSNDRLLEVSPSDLPLQEAFILADNILRQGIVGISEIITKPGLINVDFADVRSVMQNAGLALMGIGRGSGKNRAQDAALAAVTSPLLDFPIQQAKGVVYTVTGNKDMSLTEVAQVSNVIQKMVGQDANVIFGALIDENMGDEMSVIVVATNFEDPETAGALSQAAPGASRSTAESILKNNFGPGNFGIGNMPPQETSSPYNQASAASASSYNSPPPPMTARETAIPEMPKRVAKEPPKTLRGKAKRLAGNILRRALGMRRDDRF